MFFTRHKTELRELGIVDAPASGAMVAPERPAVA